MIEAATITKPKSQEEITLTSKAIEQVLKLKAENNIPAAHGLRVGVKGGGCSGFTYVLGFDSESKPADKIFDVGGVRMFVDPKSLFLLSGTELDYQDGLNGKGFIFNNPNATRTCGCGDSFSA